MTVIPELKILQPFDGEMLQLVCVTESPVGEIAYDFLTSGKIKSFPE